MAGTRGPNHPRRWPLWGKPKGKILAVKWGYNPNSSSLGVDVTFLLFGLSIITLLTPVVGFLLRVWRRPDQALQPPPPDQVGEIAHLGHEV